MRTSDVRRRLWRSATDARRLIARDSSPSPALAGVGVRSDAEAWTEALAVGHDAYRSAVPVPTERVLIACVSIRPALMQQVVDNIARQDHQLVDVAFIANDEGFDHDAVEAAFASFGSVSIDHPPAGTSLGAALNRAMGLSDARYVAKFDDDDLYGSGYLSDLLRAHTYAGAGVVGKHTYYAHLEQSDQTYLRFPANEFRYSGTLAGGTLVIDRDRVGEQQFDDISLGEDRAFLARCHRRGISTYSADRFNFTQIRTGSNTWSVPDHEFVNGANLVETDVDR